jgi:hypothetical protein
MKSTPIIASLVAGLMLVGASATAQTSPLNELPVASELPTPLRAGDIELLQEQLQGAILLGVITEQLDPRMRPSSVEAPVSILVVDLGQPHGTVLVLPNSIAARASDIRVLVNGEWLPATVRASTPLYDLALLDVPGAVFSNALTIAPANVFPSILLVGAATPVVESAPERTGQVVLAPAGFGDRIRGDLGQYRRSIGNAALGGAIIDEDGRLIAIQSLPVPDRHGGMLSLPAMWLTEWLDAGVANNPLGWSPQTTVEEVEPQVGTPALRPR